MKQWMTALGTVTAVATMTSMGCAPLVLDPVKQQEPTSSGTGVGAGGGGTTAPGGGITVIAILGKDLPAQASPPAMGSLGELSGFDADTLLVMFSNGPEPCTNPGIGEACPTADTVWQGVIAIPADLVRVGLVDLGNPRIKTFAFSYTGSGGMCGGGGGGGDALPDGGSLEIVGTDGGSISVNLITPVMGSPTITVNGVTTPSVMLQGPYTASRCEPSPTPPPPNAAVAIMGSNLPAGLPASPTIGTSPDPTALYVFFGTGTQTCADPLADLGCMGAARMTVKIPAALQQPGTLQLSDPELATSILIAANSSSQNCTDSADEALEQGTLTITSADAGGLTFTVYQSLTTTVDDVIADLDGLYQATVCQ